MALVPNERRVQLSRGGQAIVLPFNDAVATEDFEPPSKVRVVWARLSKLSMHENCDTAFTHADP